MLYVPQHSLGSNIQEREVDADTDEDLNEEEEEEYAEKQVNEDNLEDIFLHASDI